jgi:hypothetical protein
MKKMQLRKRRTHKKTCFVPMRNALDAPDAAEAILSEIGAVAVAQFTQLIFLPA